MVKPIFSRLLHSAVGQIGQSAPATLVSFASLLFHNINYEFLAPKASVENGMIITSIDIDVGSREVGLINKGNNDLNISHRLSESKIGQIEEDVFPAVLDFFNGLEIPVTIALRGQLAEVNTLITDLIVDSPVRHDVGAHGYYHKMFTELSVKEADVELNLVSRAMKTFHIQPRTFIFPRNKVAHLDLIKRFGYACYRDCGGFLRDGMYVKSVDGLYDVHPSLFINQHSNPILVKKMVDMSAENCLPFHMWFHCVDFGRNNRDAKKNISRAFSPVFEYARRKADTCNLSFETMLSTAMKGVGN